MVQVASFAFTSERLQWIFQLLDLDDTGVLSMEELVSKKYPLQFTLVAKFLSVNTGLNTGFSPNIS